MSKMWKRLISTLAAFALPLQSACNVQDSQQPPALDYEKAIPLDAESLGEGFIREGYQKYVVPALRDYVENPAVIVEHEDSVANTYSVSALGKTYRVFRPDMDFDVENHWGNATFALFDIVNRQLEGSDVRFYALNGGNDLFGIFLTQEEYDNAVAAIESERDYPYLPTPDPPMYGQPGYSQ